MTGLPSSHLAEKVFIVIISHRILVYPPIWEALSCLLHKLCGCLFAKVLYQLFQLELSTSHFQDRMHSCLSWTQVEFKKYMYISIICLLLSTDALQLILICVLGRYLGSS